MKTRKIKQFARLGTVVLLLAGVSFNPCKAQGEAPDASDKGFAPSVFEVSLGISSLDVQELKTYMEDYKQNIEHVTSTRLNNPAYAVDLGLSVKIHKQLALGFQFQSLTNRLVIEYNDYRGLNLVEYFSNEQRKEIKLKTNTILLMPQISWYYKNNLSRLYPFLQLAGGYGSASISLEGANGLTGRGSGLALAGSVGFEAGGGVFLFHLRAGYRYFDPGMSYTIPIDQSEHPDINLSGVFINVGFGFLLSKHQSK